MIRKLRYSIALILTLLLCSVTVPSFAGEKYIFVLAGQSNMVGASGEKKSEASNGGTSTRLGKMVALFGQSEKLRMILIRPLSTTKSRAA